MKESLGQTTGAGGVHKAKDSFNTTCWASTVCQELFWVPNESDKNQRPPGTHPPQEGVRHGFVIVDEIQAKCCVEKNRVGETGVMGSGACTVGFRPPGQGPWRQA